MGAQTRKVTLPGALFAQVFWVGCFYGHPVTGILPVDDARPDLAPVAALATLAISPQTQSAAPDTTPPSFSGPSSVTALSSTSLLISWSAASDDTSVASSIAYDICTSAVAGTCQTGFTATASVVGSLSHTVTGLSGYTNYYHVVRARDAAGNAETNTIQVVGRTSPILMFSTGPVTGNLMANGAGANGREGADNLCTTEKTATHGSLGCVSIRALVSIPGDLIVNMPGAYSIPSGLRLHDATNANKVADNWADLTDGNIDMSLNAAGVSSADYWTGSDSTGGLGGNHCVGFTSGAGGQNGRIGNNNSVGGTWLNDGQLACNNPRRVVCVCW